MSYDGSLKFDTKIDSNGFSAGLSKLKKLAKTGVGTVGTVTSKATDMIGKFTSVVTTSVATVSAGIGTIGTAAARVGMDFEAAMSKVSSISGATGNDLQSLTDKAKEMGATTKFSATESAEAFQYMAMAGWDTKSMLDGIDGIMNLSAADGLDLATTSDIVTDALTAFGLSAKDSTHFADVLATASSSANTNVSMLGESFKYVAPLAGSMNYSVEDVSLALGLMANASVKGSMAGTSLKTALSNLASPTDDMGKALQKLGLATEVTSTKIDQLKIDKATNKVTEAQKKYNQTVQKYGENSSEAEKAALNLKSAQENLTKAQEGKTKSIGYTVSALKNEDGSTKSLKETLVDIRKAFANLDETQQAEYASTIFGKEAMSGMLAIINASDADFNKLTDSISNADGAAKKMADTLNDNLKGDITIMKSALEGFGITIYETFDTKLRGVVQLGTKYIDELSKSFTDGGLQGAVKTAGDIFGEIATKAAENAPKMIDSALQFIDSFANGIRDNSSRLLNAGRNIVQSIIEGIIDFAGYGSELIDGAVAIIENLILAISSNESELLKAGESIIDSIVNGIVNLANNAGTVVRGVVALIQSFIKSVKNNKDKLLTAAKEIVKAITDGLVSLLPKEVQAPVKKCIEAITKFFNSNSLKKAIQSVTKFIGTLAKVITDMASKVVPPLVKVLEFLCSNLNIIGPAILTVVSAIKIYKGTVELAKIAQLGFNAAMSANPIGAAITLIEGLVTGLTALCGWLSQTSGDTEALNEAQDNYNIAAENTRKIAENYGDKLSGITEAMDKCRDGIDNATSSLDGFDESLIIPEDTKKNLEKDMTDVQTRIDKICSGYSTGRKELTQKEIEELDNLMKKQKELADKELELQSEYQTTANGIAQEFISKFKGTPEEYSEQSKTYIKGAEEARDKVITAAEEQYKKRYQLATKEYKAGAITKKAYENEKNAAWKAKEEAIKAAKEKCGQTEALITNHYTKLITGTDKFISNNNKATKAFDEAYIRAGKRIGGYHDLLEVGQINQEQYSANTKKVWEDYETDTGAILDDIVNNLDEATMTQIGDWAGLVKTTYESGGKISDDTAYMAYNIRESIKNLPDDVKKKMGDSYDKLINSFDGLPPEMYEQGKAAALAFENPLGYSFAKKMKENGANIVEGLKNGVISKIPILSRAMNVVASVIESTYKTDMDQHSPSRLMAKLGRFTVEGLELGLKDRAKKLASIAKDLAESVSGTMSNGLNNDIMLDTNAEMTARLKTAVFAQAGEIGLSVATKNANNYDTQSDSNNSVKASGNITTHINIDGREFAVATVPYIDEELAFIKG
ncbi:phage tail tape measure protein [Candidatus Pseudoruminococcus sp.]|uniref:phage tail tape measure protein n=1 Tax=Candidatus Pseudoruminococcus sp. TaxID=3101048 RepID=UPI0039997EC1